MEDLLKEDEFITTKYNPWKRFGVFYIILFIVFILYYIIQEVVIGEDPDDGQLVIMLFGLPFCVSFVMIFHKKENIGLPLKTITLALLILVMTCFLSLAVIGFMNDGAIFLEEIKFVFMFGGVYFVLFIFISAIILPVVRYKQKKKAKLRRKL